MSFDMPVKVHPESGPAPNKLVTAVLVVVLVATWSFLFAISILGSLWRFGDPDAPAPVLSVHDQVVDLAVLVVQFVVGMAAIGLVMFVRRDELKRVIPVRRGSAVDAAVAWCAAIACASAVVLVLNDTGIARFDFAVPATVGSPWLAVLAALSTGLREEPVLAALPLVLLIGRVPVVWIMLLGGAMRGVLYLYAGVGGFLWAFVWGAAAVWVYYRFGRLWVLVLVHGFVVNIAALDRIVVHDSAATVLQWVNIMMLFGALLWWVVPRALAGVSSNAVSDRSAPTSPTE